ncbi:alpha/beta hydrolase family protein [Erythrobacter aureus]|uniref:alpha/beta hydrolase family protein n=1 Tax=Erythrobacter aureus TaxID=2182384 RepID=UPI001F2299DC|nr:hypothetical protein [Erythrobacter aureus]
MQILSKAVVAASLLALGGTAIALPAQAETREETAARYGVRASVLDISLSPSGDKIAFIAPGPQHSEVLNVIDLSGDASVKTIAGNTEIKADMTQCEWATESRLVCKVWVMTQNDRGLLLPYDRMFAVNDDGSESKLLTERRSSSALGIRQDGGDIVALDVAGEDGHILMTREYVKEFSVGSRFANDKQGLGVDLVDIVSGSRAVLERPDQNATRFIADQTGRIRIKVRSLADGRGVLTGDSVYMYRTEDSDAWRRLDDITIDGETVSDFHAVAVDSDRDVAFGFVTRDGFDALAEVTLDGSAKGRMLLARDDVDVDRLIRIGRQRRVVGASYATEKREVEYFDEELKVLASGLSQALPDTPLINIVGASADENRLLIVASSDTQPGTSYLFDKETKSLEPLLAIRNYLVDRTMGAMTSIAYPASDGTSIPGYLTLPPGKEAVGLPAIVLPHGGHPLAMSGGSTGSCSSSSRGVCCSTAELPRIFWLW